MKMEQSVQKLRHIKFRSRGITQKKAYNLLPGSCGVSSLAHSHILPNASNLLRAAAKWFACQYYLPPLVFVAF
jgi:hypothetical protein